MAVAMYFIMVKSAITRDIIQSRAILGVERELLDDIQANEPSEAIIDGRPWHGEFSA
jgi:hypothetical protein